MIERSLYGDVHSARLARPSTPATGVGCDQKEARAALLGETRTVPLTLGRAAPAKRSPGPRRPKTHQGPPDVQSFGALPRGAR